VMTCAIGHGLTRGVAHRSARTRLLAAGAASWMSVLAAALATSLELWLSGTARLAVVIPAMVGLHAIIGLGEALITVAALAFILKTRPDLLDLGRTASRDGPGWIAAGFVITALTLLLAPIASNDPDGLERVAKDLGLLPAPSSAWAPFAGYGFPGVPGDGAAPLMAGLLGVLVVGTIIFIASRALRQRR